MGGVEPAVRWRLGSKQRSKGRYFWLETGRDETRRSLTLGFIVESQAQTALELMNREEAETEGTPMHGRMERLFESEPEKAIRYLTKGDTHAGAPLPFGPRPADLGALSLQEYHDQEYATWRKEKKPKTWVTEAGRWRRILPALGRRRVRDLDAHIVADFIDSMLVERDGRQQPASGATRRLVRNAVQALLNHAHRQKHIATHVDLGVFRIEGSTKTVLPKVAPLNIEELQRLMDASSPKHRAMWAVGAGEGLRPSELRRLHWDDVLWESRTMKLRGDEDGEGKTAEAVAEIPLTPIAFRELRSWWLRQGQPAAGFIFSGDRKKAEDGTDEGYASRSAYRGALSTAARKAKIGRPVSQYLLRHSFATIAWSLGIEMDVARRILRHTDEKMLRDVYCRPRPADLVAKVAAFDFS